MKRLIIAFAVLFAFLAVVPETDAWFGRRRGRRSVSVGAGNYPTDINPKYQVIAQERANEMARQGNLSHGIGGVSAAPAPEGIGCATWEDPEDVATCVCGSVVTADAHCKSANGMWYRVRFWR